METGAPSAAHQLALILHAVDDDERLVVGHIPAQLVLPCAQHSGVAAQARSDRHKLRAGASRAASDVLSALDLRACSRHETRTC